MRCDRIDLGNGAVGIVCSRGQRSKTCSACKRNRATLECDWPLAGKKAGKTCDRALCRPCALLVKSANGDTVDYCPAHAEQHKAGACRPGAWGGPGCLMHEGFELDASGRCIEGRRAVAAKPAPVPPRPAGGQVGLFEPEATRGLFTPPVRK